MGDQTIHQLFPAPMKYFYIKVYSCSNLTSIYFQLLIFHNGALGVLVRKLVAKEYEVEHEGVHII